MPKDVRKKERVYKASMLLKYWKATNEEPLMDLCMIIVMYAQDIEPGLLYAVGFRVAPTKNRFGRFKNVNTLSRIRLRNKGEKETLAKGVVNGNEEFHAFLLKNGKVRVIETDGSTFDIVLRLKIIAMNSGNCCTSLFVLNSKMRAYEIKGEKPAKVTGLPNGTKIKDISCGDRFTVFLSECRRVFGIGMNEDGRLGLPRRIEKTEIPTEIIFSNQSNSDKNGIIITMIYASQYGWVAVDSKQRAWVAGDHLMKSVRRDFVSLNPCISIVEVWYSNDIRITQIECGFQHVIALDTEGRVYWFGRFNNDILLSHVSLDPIPFQHRITLIRSGYGSVACKDATNEWYIWGLNSVNHLTCLCSCEVVHKETKENNIISNPMRCGWQGLFDSSRVINLQLGYWKAHVIVDTFN